MGLMAKGAFSKAIRVGRATVLAVGLAVGLAVVLALLLGAATTAMGATGANLILGKPNAAETPTSLVSTLADAVKPALNVHNKSGGPALNLNVASEQAPIRVNASAGTAKGLSADELDGKSASDFAASHIFATVNADGSLDEEVSSSHAVSSSRLQKGIYLFDFDRNVGRIDGCIHVAQPLDEAALTMTSEGPRYGGPLTQVQVQMRDAAGEHVDGAVSLAVFCE